MNRRATAVLLTTFAAALAVMIWLVREMRTAAASSGPPSGDQRRHDARKPLAP
jgi:hypothetical protein